MNNTTDMRKENGIILGEYYDIHDISYVLPLSDNNKNLNKRMTGKYELNSLRFVTFSSLF